MRTPKEYIDNLKKNIITEDMLENCLYSVNKRAKNWRDKKREYRSHSYDKYHNAEKAEVEETKMYERKDALLALLSPICIHKEFAGFKKTRVYSYEDSYDEIKLREIFKGSIVLQNSYFARDDYEDAYEDSWMDDYYDDYWMTTGHYVYFFDYEDMSIPEYRYYLFYRIGEHSYHTPINEEEAQKSDLPQYYIDTLQTSGHEIDDLISVQFVDKVIKLVKSGDYFRSGKWADSEYLKTLQLAERERAIDGDAFLNAERKRKKSSLIREEWDYISKEITSELAAKSLIISTPYELSPDEKLEIQKATMEKMEKTLMKKDYLKLTNPKKIHNTEKDFRRGCKYYKNVEKEFILGKKCIDSIIDTFQNDSNVTLDKLCQFYLEHFFETDKEHFLEKEKEMARETYIKSKEQSWKDKVLASFRKKRAA